MKEFIAACVQISITPNNVAANVAKGIAWLEKAVQEHRAELVVFPETVTTGYETGLGPGELWQLVDAAPGRITQDVQAAAKEMGVYVVWPSYRRGPEPGVVYNSAILIGPDGEICGIYDKTHPAPWERREGGGWVEIGDRAEVYQTDLGVFEIADYYAEVFAEQGWELYHHVLQLGELKFIVLFRRGAEIMTLAITGAEDGVVFWLLEPDV